MSIPRIAPKSMSKIKPAQDRDDRELYAVEIVRNVC